MAICAIVVSYNPSPSLLENVAALASQVDEVVVVDNGSSSESRDILAQLDGIPGCRLICNADNLGIAAALNAGVRYALTIGYDWIATFDQDSTVTDGYIHSLIDAWEECPFRDQVALVSPRYRDRKTGLISSYDRKKSQGKSAEVQTTMTSGNIVRADAFERAGFFDESFFMDCVDHEFCLRLRRNGYRIVESRDSILLHSLGDMTLHRLLGRQFKVYNHLPFRRYYNVRNRIVIYRRYLFRFPAWIFHDLFNLCREIAGIVLFEKDSALKLSAVCRGAFDGIAGKTGRTW